MQGGRHCFRIVAPIPFPFRDNSTGKRGIMTLQGTVISTVHGREGRDMSARGHAPRTSARGRTNQVGVVASHQFVGVSDYTRNASRDVADVVGFDMAVDRWLAAGFAVDPAEAYGLAKQRKAAR